MVKVFYEKYKENYVCILVELYLFFLSEHKSSFDGFILFKIIKGEDTRV